MDVVKKNQSVIIGIVIAVVVGLMLGYGWGRQTAPTGTEMAVERPATTTAMTSETHLLGTNAAAAKTTVAEGNSLAVSGQPAGMSVTLTSVTLSQEAWIAIRDSSGKTLGAALFPAGTHSDVSVSLLRATTAGQSYQALIYFDDGTKTFDLKTESVVLNEDGSVAGTTFSAQ